jgi:hypothetical protein
MARHQYYSDPSQKHLEVYYDFSGGLNTVTSNDNLENYELTKLVNMDLNDRGSIKRRHGMSKYLSSPVEGNAQGYFRYFKNDGTFEEILAINGKIYKDGEVLTITDLNEFQKDRPIEAVQFGTTLYLATGTKLVQYDGTEAKPVEPYAPEPLEALYIGTNALADDPDNYISDGEATFLRIDGVTVTKRYGVSNQETVFEAIVSKPVGSTIEYQFKYRKKDTETWTVGQDFSTKKTFSFIPTSTGVYEIDVYAREQGEVDETKYVLYIIPTYEVKETNDNEQVDSSTIHTCNRILLHWSRLVLYGDTEQPEAIYVSHVNRGDYFPVPNSILFTNERQEGLTSLVRFRDGIIAFTPTSIQALFGKQPSEYQRVTLNTAVGCIAPYTAQVMGNYVAFLSREGVHILKNIGYTEDRLNVEKIDLKIDNLVPRETNACAASFDGQYRIVFPTHKKQYRYYYNFKRKPWTSDESEKLNFLRFYEHDGELYGLALDGNVYKFDSSLSDDGFIYKDVFETKYFDFGQPYNMKKLKEVQVMLGHQSLDNNYLKMWIYADSSKALTPEKEFASIDENGNVLWNVSDSPNIEVLKGTILGKWMLGKSPFGLMDTTIKKLRVSGKCRRMKIVAEHEQATHNELLGIATIFKIKRP